MDNNDPDQIPSNKEIYAKVSLVLPELPAIPVQYAVSLRILLIDLLMLWMLINLWLVLNLFIQTGSATKVLNLSFPARTNAFVVKHLRHVWVTILARLYVGLIGMGALL